MIINTERLADILQRSSTAEAFATYAACRERNARSGISKLSALRTQMQKEGFNPIPQDMLAMFKELEQAGLGQLRGDVFKWNLPLKRVGELAEEASVVKLPKPAPQLNVEPEAVQRSLVVCFGGNKRVSISITGIVGKEELQMVVSELLKNNK